jgi:putative membrane protein
MQRKVDIATMIIRPRLSFWQTLLSPRGDVLHQIREPLLFFGLWSTAVVAAHAVLPSLVHGHSPGPYALVGVALSIFFSFRNNACYERWWEGRCQWGHLVLSVRNFARQSQILEASTPGERARLLTLVIGFCYALVTHLRPAFPVERAMRWLSAVEQGAFMTAPNHPDAVLQVIGARLSTLREEGRISDISFQVLDHMVQQFALVQGSCERIRSSPVPFSYNHLLQVTTFIFLFALPFGFIDTLGWKTIVSEVIIGYIFLGLDVIGDELEEPFGERPNNLPIAALAQVIEIELRAAMGETDLPPLPKPVDFVLT